MTSFWWRRRGSNPRPSDYDSPALPLSYAAIRFDLPKLIDFCAYVKEGNSRGCKRQAVEKFLCDTS